MDAKGRQTSCAHVSRLQGSSDTAVQRSRQLRCALCYAEVAGANRAAFNDNMAGHRFLLNLHWPNLHE